MENKAFFEKIKSRHLPSLSRAFTLNESALLEDNKVIDSLLKSNPQFQNKSKVISISGIPGVGKSTFIEKYGKYLHSLGKSIAVFSIDPTSEISRGSILGDKTRMTELSSLPNVFIRPSPSNLELGGIGSNTYRNIEIAKIAGYDYILIETVGVGQSETIAKQLCDIFLLLIMPSSGDELQGVKKGIMEIADIFIVNKADGNLIQNAASTMKDVSNALHLSNASENKKVISFSSIEKGNEEKIQKIIEEELEKKNLNQVRTKQREYWFKNELSIMINKKIAQKINASISKEIDLIQKGKIIGKGDVDLLANKLLS